MLTSISAFSAVSAAAKTKLHRKDGYIYAYVDGDVQIIRYYGNKSTVEVPSKIDGKNVFKIGWGDSDDFDEDRDALDFGGFSDNKSVKKVVIPDTVVELEDLVFDHCTNLNEVVLGDGIETIPPLAFKDCKKLSSVTLPSSLETIGAYAFRDCISLKKLKLPANLKTIEWDAFSGSGITKLHLNKKLKDARFWYCPKLKSLTVNKENNYFSAKKGVLYNKNKTTLLCYPPKKSTVSFTVPKTVKKIEEYAFVGCNKLKKVKLSKNLLTIEGMAITDCKQLKKVIVKNAKMKIKDHALGFYLDGTWQKVKGFTIYAKKNSSAEKYARKHKFNFKTI